MTEEGKLELFEKVKKDLGIELREDEVDGLVRLLHGTRNGKYWPEDDWLMVSSRLELNQFDKECEEDYRGVSLYNVNKSGVDSSVSCNLEEFLVPFTKSE